MNYILSAPLNNSLRLSFISAVYDANLHRNYKSSQASEKNIIHYGARLANYILSAPLNNSLRLLFLLFMMPIFIGIIGYTKPQTRMLSDKAQMTNEIRVRGRWMLNHFKLFIGIHS